MSNLTKSSQPDPSKDDKLSKLAKSNPDNRLALPEQAELPTRPVDFQEDRGKASIDLAAHAGAEQGLAAALSAVDVTDLVYHEAFKTAYSKGLEMANQKTKKRQQEVTDSARTFRSDLQSHADQVLADLWE